MRGYQPTHDLPGHGHEHTISLFTRVRVAQLERQVQEMRMRHEAEVRAKDETIGELLSVLDERDRFESALLNRALGV